jgi:hypothetical protein
MPTSERDPELQTLLDRQAIHDVLMRYSRGLDRHDRKVLESVYWPDAVDGLRARSETYYIGYHDMPGPLGREDFFMGGRYLDLMQKRSGQWRIKKRVLTCDWYSRSPSSAAWGTGILADLKTRGERYPDDPLYRVFDGKD